MMCQFDNIMVAADDCFLAAEVNDMTALVETLEHMGVVVEEMGDALFCLARQALAEGRLVVARNILLFLEKGIVDKNDATPILRLIGDIFYLEGQYEKARECYGRLPLTVENIRLCGRTYVPQKDLEGLLAFREHIVGRFPHNNGVIDDLVEAIVKDVPSDDRASCRDLFRKNIGVLRTLLPFRNNQMMLEREFGTRETRARIVEVNKSLFLWDGERWMNLDRQRGTEAVCSFTDHGDNNFMVICDTLGDVEWLIEYMRETSSNFYKFECIVVISISLLRQAMFLFDFSPLGAGGYVVVFADSDDLASSLDRLIFDEKINFPQVVFGGNHDVREKVQLLLVKYEKRLLSYIKRLGESISDIYPISFGEDVHRKIQCGEPLRILFKTTIYSTYVQYSIRDLANAFRELGHDVFVEKEKEGAGCGVRYDVVLENIVRFRPDIIFCIDHLRYEFPVIPDRIPFVTWVQDFLAPVTKIKDSNLISHNDYVISYNQKGLEYFRQHPAYKDKKCGFVPIPVNPEVYHPIEGIGKKYDVTYVSHLFDPEETLQPFREGRVPGWVSEDYEIKLYSQAVKEYEILPIMDVWRICTDFDFRLSFVKMLCGKTGVPFSEKILSLFAGEYDLDGVLTPVYLDLHFYLKVRPVRYLLNKGIDVKVWGRNWNKVEDVAGASMGVMENGAPLNLLANQTKVNLNLSVDCSYQMRAAEIMGGKGFMISRRIWNDSLPITQLFREQDEVVFFDSDEDLFEMVNFYLANKKERERIAERAHQRIVREYTYQSSVDKFLKFIDH